VTGPLVAVLDYGIGNLHSAHKALERVGADARLTADPGLIADADAVVLPGVGAFGACMTALQACGLVDPAQRAVEEGRPFLGICVGMQLLAEGSEESPGVAGLGILPVEVVRIPGPVKLPQMQWNEVHVRVSHPLFDGVGDPPWMYFVHSFALVDGPETIATCDYGGPIVAAVARDNVVAVQFHPEKSGEAGLRLLRNFVEWCR
jgi:glutamine amidotransferase